MSRNTIRLVLTVPCLLLSALLVAGCASKGQTFATPDEAVTALVGALHPYDAEKLHTILGPESDDVIASGDSVTDQRDFDGFIAKYTQRHHFEDGADDSKVLVVGEQDWPMPIPLAHSGSGYWFDTAKGKDEILARRIGRNELDTIQTCRAIVDAQREYFASTASGATGTYAAKFRSDAGKRNGLYWPTSAGEPDSPLGALAAEASAMGYHGGGDANAGPRPYHGYCYRMLTAQGASAPGGARSYLESDRLTGGFAVLAYPVDYDNSGIMTFIINQNGILYQQDLGEDTEKAAQAITSFEPDESWTVVP